MGENRLPLITVLAGVITPLLLNGCAYRNDSAIADSGASLQQQFETGSKAKKLLSIVEELRSATTTESQERLVEEIIAARKQPQRRSERVPSIFVLPVDGDFSPVEWGSLMELEKIKFFIVHDAFHNPPMYPELVFIPQSKKVILLLRKLRFEGAPYQVLD